MDRRAFLSGSAAVLAGAAALLSPAGKALAQSGQRVRRIVVDTRPLEGRGGRGAAAIVGARLRESLNREFAGRLGAGPDLVVRVHTVLLGTMPMGGGDGFAGPSSDYMEVDFAIGGRREPLLVTLSSDSAGVWYLPDNEPRRLRALADSAASWIGRRT